MGNNNLHLPTRKTQTHTPNPDPRPGVQTYSTQPPSTQATMSLSFDYTSTKTLTNTFTVGSPTPTSDSAYSIGAPVIYSTVPDADPSGAKLIPVLVVTEYYITIEGAGGTVTGHTTTHVTPNVVITLPSESGDAFTVGTNNMNRFKAMGWESWTGKERWGVLAALGAGIALLLAGGGWLIWVRFGRARWMKRRSTASKTGGGGDVSMKNTWPTGREQGTRSLSRREGTDRRGRRPSDTRYQMSGGLGDSKSEMSERGGNRPLL